MAETTNIEWADGTANFWMGCTKLSPACDFCYAERDWDHRKHRVTWGPHGDRVPVKAGEPVIRKHQRQAASFIAAHGRRPRIFVNSLSDFADNHRSINPTWRARIWELARECPDVILMILTKRPQNLPDYLPADWGDGYPNVWIGTTVENQIEADRRREYLRAVPAIVHFVSYEPALGTVDWQGWEFLKWLISGGESGPKARPSHPDWYRAARDFCGVHNIPYLHKQNGEWVTEDQSPPDAIFPGEGRDFFDDGSYWARLGKKVAGRLLDGSTHDGYPEMAHG